MSKLELSRQYDDEEHVVTPATFTLREELQLLVARWALENECNPDAGERYYSSEEIDDALIQDCARVYMANFCVNGNGSSETSGTEPSLLVQSVGGLETALGRALMELEQETQQPPVTTV